jgi:antitoxin CptB
MTDDAESRRRRALYRASHRGTKEMDWLLGRYAAEQLAGMGAQTLERFERLLTLPDPELHDMIIYPEMAPAGEFADLISDLRAFHGLEPDNRHG